MTPIDWALRPLKKYADFSGRAPRAEYWWFTLAAGLASWSVEFLDPLTGGPIIGIYGPLSLILTAVLLIPGIAVTVRRLHDIDRSGWWVLLSAWSYLLVIVGLITSDFEGLFAQFEGLEAGVLIIPVLAMFVMAITMLVFTVTRGTEGANSYGDDPYGPDKLEEVFA